MDSDLEYHPLRKIIERLISWIRYSATQRKRKILVFPAESRLDLICLNSMGKRGSVTFYSKSLLYISDITGDPKLVFHVADFGALGRITGQITSLACDLPSGNVEMSFVYQF